MKILITLAFLLTGSLIAAENETQQEQANVPNTVDLTTEVVKLNQESARSLASETQELNSLDSNDLQFWYLDENTNVQKN